MQEELNIPCRIRVESGSIGGEPTFIWIDAIVTRKIDNYQYVVREASGDGLFYVQPQEIWMSLYDFKLIFDERF